MQEFVNKNIVRASTTKRAQSRRKQLEKKWTGWINPTVTINLLDLNLI